MKVKVGNKIYDGEKEPIMLIFDKGDKVKMANMSPDNKRY